MRSRAPFREIRVGLVVLAAIGGLAGLVALASGGPGFLASRRTVDVVFRDGQGIRVGSPVRVAGIDAGRVQAVDLAEVDGTLRARLRLALPSELVGRLKQDARIAVQSGLTGQACVNILSSGRSELALVPGQVVQGVETSMFDPILEQVGLGAVERTHLSHTIGEVRQTVDAIGPRLKLALVALSETMSNLRDASAAVKPSVEVAAGRVEEIARKLDPEKLQATLERLSAVIAHADGLLAETRPNLQATLTNVRTLSGTLNETTQRGRPKVEALLDGLNGSLPRVNQVLANTATLTGQGAEIVSHTRANIERTSANVRDATDNANQLVSKLKANPLLLSPLYKPRPEDIRAQQLYEASTTVMSGIKEMNDALTKMNALRSRKDLTPQEAAAYSKLYEQASTLNAQMQQVTAQLAEGLRGTMYRR